MTGQRFCEGVDPRVDRDDLEVRPLVGGALLEGLHDRLEREAMMVEVMHRGVSDRAGHLDATRGSHLYPRDTLPGCVEELGPLLGLHPPFLRSVDAVDVNCLVPRDGLPLLSVPPVVVRRVYP